MVNKTPQYLPKYEDKSWEAIVASYHDLYTDISPGDASSDCLHNRIFAKPIIHLNMMQNILPNVQSWSISLNTFRWTGK